MTTLPLPGVSARDWAAMSWHQRARYRKALLIRLETERPARRVDPVIVGPYSRVGAGRHDPTDPAVSVALSVAIHALVVGLRTQTQDDFGLAAPA